MLRKQLSYKEDKNLAATFRKLYPQSRSRKFAHAGSTIKGLYLSVFSLFFQYKCVITLKLQIFGSQT